MTRALRCPATASSSRASTRTAPIEAIRIADAPGFALGVQWHAEYDPQKNPVNRKLFEAFGQALQAHSRD